MTAGDKPRWKLTDEERALWRGVTRSIAPLKGRAVIVETAETATVAPKPRPAPAKQTHAATARPAPAPKRPPPPPPLMPIDRRTKQRLGRGTEPIDGRIDLHGRTQSEAHAALLRYLRKAQDQGARTVLVITGKGGRGDASGERGVLKRQVPMWLRLPEFRGFVLGVEDAHIGHGGEGALYVRLRKAR
jgi:DNA-nicking Smr family endonuclease